VRYGWIPPSNGPRFVTVQLKQSGQGASRRFGRVPRLLFGIGANLIYRLRIWAGLSRALRPTVLLQHPRDLVPFRAEILAASSRPRARTRSIKVILMRRTRSISRIASAGVARRVARRPVCGLADNIAGKDFDCAREL
jgi:hypothetical protein